MGVDSDAGGDRDVVIEVSGFFNTEVTEEEAQRTQRRKDRSAKQRV
jgi:hypothetical protein